MNVLSLFSGIGGFDLGLERAGMTIVGQCEIDPYCQRVLAKHWPSVPRYGDIKELTGAEFRDIDLICGGFPCQPVSHAGRRMGEGDDRYLWPEMLRLIRAVQPTYVLAENVYGLVTHDGGTLLASILADLEVAGYEVAPPFVLPACAVGAPHRRDRVWVCAHLRHDWGASPEYWLEQEEWAKGALRLSSHSYDAGFDRPEIYKRPREEGRGALESLGFGWWRREPRVGRVVHGLSSELDRARLAALGNAVVPQIAEYLGLRIMAVRL